MKGSKRAERNVVLAVCVGLLALLAPSVAGATANTAKGTLTLLALFAPALT